MKTRCMRAIGIAAAVAAMLIACSDRPTAPDAGKSNGPQLTRQFALSTGEAEVIHGTSSPPSTSTRVIGPAGGTIMTRSARLWVPAGALDRDVAITMTQPDGERLQFQFQPHGLVFKQPAVLTFSLDGTGLTLESAKTELQGVYYQQTVDDLQVVPREVMPITAFEGRPAFGIWHFCGYAVVRRAKGLILVGN